MIYIGPSRTDFVVPFNVLATEGTPYDIASAILEVFRRTWPESLRGALHFSNVATAALIVLVENKLTLMEHRLLTDTDFREQCLEKVSGQSAVEYFHQRYDHWGEMRR